MEDVKLVEKMVIVPDEPTPRRRIFLSNIDLTFVAYQESVSFFDPPSNNMSFSDACQCLYRAFGRLLMDYDFWAGRLVSANNRLEIDCNGAGIVVVAAKVGVELNQLGDPTTPKPEFMNLVALLHEEHEGKMDIKDMPLLLIQFTQFSCGSLAFASRFNHCVMDGRSVHEFEVNLAAFTRGNGLVLVPNPDRTVFRARNPPEINHPHDEYSKITDSDTIEQPRAQNHTRVVYISPQRAVALKKAVNFENCSTFQVLAARIWKAWSVATKLPEESSSTILLSVDVRKRVVPNAPLGFSGNAVMPGFAKAKVKEIKESEESILVKRVKEGIERLNDEYVKSAIDWLEVNRGVPCRVDSFLLVAWWGLGLEEADFVWGRVKSTVPIVVKPDLVFLLPGPKAEGGLNICLNLPEEQVKEFHRIMMIDF